jgi:beta-galactosidase
VYRASFVLPQEVGNATLTLALRSLGREQSVYLNGQPIAQNVPRDNNGHEFPLPTGALRSGTNLIAVVATPQPGGPVTRGGGRGRVSSPGQIRVVTSPGNWKRSVFNGLAQVIVQSSQQPGEITLTVSSPGVSSTELKLQTQAVALRAAIPSSERTP